MQNVVCRFNRCGSRSPSGFCLNRMVVITQQGQCERLLKEGWEKPLEKEFKSTYNYWLEQQEKEKGVRESVQIPAETGDNDEKRGQSQLEDQSK